MYKDNQIKILNNGSRYNRKLVGMIFRYNLYAYIKLQDSDKLHR